ncbi:uncharacterized protein RAG0_11183 [Rhynchosporium agropyri]|uniref:Uncharacterized protein n=1 Tax=Rhynchosporium agropyri TaxID=914238 RepID=A0A1E1L339_9HELO|nr:uncharacterized protein RAG0_11183 [Rhynchosporium agropyri]
MHLSTLTTQLVLITLTLVFLFSDTVFASNSLPEDLVRLRGHILSPGCEYAPHRITGTIGGTSINYTGTIEQVIAKIKIENPGINIIALIAADSALLKSRSLARSKDLNVLGLIALAQSLSVFAMW